MQKNPTISFKNKARDALKNEALQDALKRAKAGFIDKRRIALETLPEFITLRQEARAIKEHTLTHLDFYLTRFEQQVNTQGGQVHWADTPQAACALIIDLCKAVNAKQITKSKSMISEEIGLNRALEQAQFSVVETDLGEYIIQLAQEPPSHIIAPAVHKSREAVAALFRVHHPQHVAGATTIPELVNEARRVLRKQFLSADVGITGANFLVAASGSVILVTNEGNADLTHTLPKTHIVVTSIDKVVPTLEDATTLLRLLGRSATGQVMTTYTSVITGSRRPADKDGPINFHVVLVNNGRTEILGTELQPILHCIRCGACLNHCPVYSAIGGHAYGWVYPGPLGSVLTPLLNGLPETCMLPEASTLCSRCEDVCPLQIPLPNLLRQLRTQIYQTGLTPRYTRWLLTAWAFIAQRPRFYHLVSALGVKILHFFGHKRGTFYTLPLLNGWSQSRNIPVPQGETFMTLYKKRQVKDT